MSAEPIASLDALVQALVEPVPPAPRVRAFEGFVEALEHLDPATSSACVERLLPLLSHEDPRAASTAALALGCLVESGVDDSRLLDPFVSGLAGALEQAARFVERSGPHVEEARHRPAADSIVLEGRQGGTIGSFLLGRGELEFLAQIAPVEARAWNGLEYWFRAGVALCSNAGHAARLAADPRLHAALGRLRQLDPAMFQSLLGNSETGHYFIDRLEAPRTTEVLVLPWRRRGSAVRSSAGGVLEEKLSRPKAPPGPERVLTPALQALAKLLSRFASSTEVVELELDLDEAPFAILLRRYQPDPDRLLDRSRRGAVELPGEVAREVRRHAREYLDVEKEWEEWWSRGSAGHRRKRTARLTLTVDADGGWSFGATSR